MKQFRADLHVHTVLSPCGDLDMSPVRIIREAKQKRIDILGITDHNSTLHCELAYKLGEKESITVLMGVELNSKEEVHCLAFFENIQDINQFQQYIDLHLPSILNSNERFGLQLQVDENENIIREIDKLLIQALDVSIYELSCEVKKYGGIFIPAHIDRPYNGIMSQLGFIPDDISFDALEISSALKLNDFFVKKPEYKAYQYISGSDAHYSHQLGSSITYFDLEEPTFHEIQLALGTQQNRRVYFQ